MIAVAYYSVLALNSLLFYRKKHNSLVVHITVLLLGFMFVSNIGEFGDHWGYKLTFENGDESDDLLYNKFMILVKEFGIRSYNLFLLCLYMLCSFLAAKGISKFTKNVHPLFFVSMLYILPLLGIALRFCLGLSVFIYSLKYLKENKIWQYVLLVIIASSCHLSLFFTIVYIIPFLNTSTRKVKIITKEVYNRENASTYFWVLCLSFVCAAFIYMSKSFFLANIGQLFAIVADRSGGSNVEGTTTNNGGLLLSPCYLLCMFISYKLWKQYQKVDNENLRRLTSFNYYINIFSSIFLPLLFVNLVFIRLLIIPTIVLSLTIGYIYETSNYSNRNNFNIGMFFTLLAFSWFIPAYFAIFSLNSEIWIEFANEFWNL